MKSNKTIVGIFSFFVVFFLVAIDQFTKKIVMLNIPEDGDITVINKVFKIVYAKNTGAAWGIFRNSTVFLSVLSAVLMILFIILFFRLDWSIKRQRPLMVIGIFVVSGAIGNLIDRIFLKYVVDFLYFELIDFPVFNVADCYITVSMIVLAVLMLFYYKEEDMELIWRKKSS